MGAVQLLNICVFVLLVLEAMTGDIPTFVPWMFLGGLLLLAVYDCFQNEKLDHPQPEIYDLKPAAVWAQLDRVLRTQRSKWKNVSISIDYSDPEPPPGEPIFVQATVSISHPNLKNRELRPFLEAILPAEHHDLKSRIVLKAYVERTDEGKSKLTLDWKTESLLGRAVENDVIASITGEVSQLIEAHASNASNR